MTASGNRAPCPGDASGTTHPPTSTSRIRYHQDTMSETRPTDLATRIGREVLWAPVAVVVLHWLIGGWLGHEPVVDPIMHFSGGVAAAFFFWESSIRGRRYVGDLSPLALALLSFGMASALAVGWELCEFVVDEVRGTNIQRGVANTMRDLALGLAGAFLFSVTWMRLGRTRARSRRTQLG